MGLLLKTGFDELGACSINSLTNNYDKKIEDINKQFNTALYDESLPDIVAMGKIVQLVPEYESRFDILAEIAFNSNQGRESKAIFDISFKDVGVSGKVHHKD